MFQSLQINEEKVNVNKKLEKRSIYQDLSSIVPNVGCKLRIFKKNMCAFNACIFVYPEKLILHVTERKAILVEIYSKFMKIVQNHKN